MELEEKYLPIGTVVRLHGFTKKIMITGFRMIENNNENTVWDYSGCSFPEGIVSSTEAVLFNHSEIEKIEYNGYVDEEEKNFKQILK